MYKENKVYGHLTNKIHDANTLVQIPRIPYCGWDVSTNTRYNRVKASRHVIRTNVIIKRFLIITTITRHINTNFGRATKMFIQVCLMRFLHKRLTEVKWW